MQNNQERSTVIIYFFLLLSGLKTQSDNTSEGLETGADGYLIKPLQKREFLARVDAATRTIRAEKTLRESEEKYRFLLEGSILGILAFDIETHQCSFSNVASCKLFGYSEQEISRLNLPDFHPKDSFEKVLNEFKSQWLGEKSISNNLPCLRKDGTIFYADISGYSTVINGRNCSIGFIMDVTKRRKVEEKLHEKDVQFRKLSSNLPDLIVQFTRRPDGTYCVPIASEGIKNIFGCSPEDVVEDFAPIARVIYPEDSERVIIDIEYSAKHLTYFTCEFRVQIPGKPIQWIFSRSTPEKLADGSITWYGFNANITDMKQTEFELIRAKEKAEESDRLKSEKHLFPFFG